MLLLLGLSWMLLLILRSWDNFFVESKYLILKAE